MTTDSGNLRKEGKLSLKLIQGALKLSDPKGLEICEQGTLLLRCPKDVWASSKKNYLQSECARNVGEKKSVITFPWEGKEKGAYKITCLLLRTLESWERGVL